MNAPTIIIAAVIAVIFLAIIGRGVYNRKHHKGGCSCGCGDCPGKGLCHPEESKPPT